ncbi:polyprenyl synthetase family protein [Nafulsella turpanensis]|uniref:polyprenyl synthetase family protein n=1 Tax=Nafulsella turpanensis TaxID=1265690 RepID=UPI000349E657|nr:polyprenyl synthetase family protein [Nafulsella turpanensis]
MKDPYLHGLVDTINREIAHYTFGEDPAELYEPIRYMMALGGKRLRPVLTLLGHSLWKEDTANALKPALAVEVFHNFTLMHDDIMDQAPLRRGEPTVHEKWNANIAILSGDVMLVKAYELLLNAQPAILKSVLQKFNQCAAEVCEGQQFDMNFESRQQVSQEEYLNMIRLKTAVLLGFSLELGAMLAGASEAESAQLYQFGTNIGIGFQLQDDLLDVYADKEKFGKQVGGDILSNKKTFLLINALERAEGATATQLQSWLQKTSYEPEEKVAAITAIYEQLGIRALTEAKMNEYFEQAFSLLDQLELPEERKKRLLSFTHQLIMRDK